VAGGFFTAAGGVAANNIARWNGSTWSAVGSGMDNTVSALTVLPNGDLVAGGFFTTAGAVAASRIARWDGSAWSSFGSGMNSGITALAVLPNGDLVASGGFTTAGGVAANSIARWNGSTWSSLGSGMNSGIAALITLPNGDLVAGGFFTAAGGVAASRIARWNGSTWSTLGGGMDNTVNALTVLPNGEVVAGGDFTTAGGSVSAYLARYIPTCPATAVPTGTACPGSGGPNTYAATNLPWIGTTFRARSTTIPTFAFVAVVTGFTPISISLSSLLPPSPPACNLLITPDSVEVTISNAGAVDTQLAIPNSVALASLQLHQQLILLEVDPSLVFLENTSSNALSLTIGAF
jgi:hypothetical protein